MIQAIRDYMDFYPDGKPSGRERPAAFSHDKGERLFPDFFDSGKNQLAIKALEGFVSLPISGKDAFLLCLCGDAGTGKTHLLNAICSRLREKFGNKKILMGNARQFCRDHNEFMDHRRGLAFWQAHNALILDDLQEIAEERLLQNFLAMGIEQAATFNRQNSFPGTGALILAFTGIAAELGRLEKRLRLRLQSGLIFELSPADFAARLQFVEKFCQDEHISLKKEQQLFLAREIGLIPSLTGILHKIRLYISAYGHNPGMGELETFVGTQGEKRKGSWKEILALVAAKLNIRPQEIMSTSRKPALALARQISMYLCRTQLGMGYQEIGKIFGGRDHSTVIHGINKVKMLKDTDKVTQNLLTDLEDGVAYGKKYFC